MTERGRESKSKWYYFCLFQLLHLSEPISIKLYLIWLFCALWCFMMLCNTLFLCAVSLYCTVLYCTVNCVALYWTELCSTLHRTLIQNFCVLKLPIINAYFIRTKNCQCSRHRDNRGLFQNGAASAVLCIAFQSSPLSVSMPATPRATTLISVSSLHVFPLLSTTLYIYIFLDIYIYMCILHSYLYFLLMIKGSWKDPG